MEDSIIRLEKKIDENARNFNASLAQFGNMLSHMMKTLSNLEKSFGVNGVTHFTQSNPFEICKVNSP